MLNINGGVQVAVVLDTACTAPGPLAEVELIANYPARRAALTGRKEAINDDQLFPVPIGFVGQQEAKATMGSIGKRTTQLGFRKSTHVQILDGDDMAAFDDPPTLLVQKISTLLAHTLIRTRQSNTGFAAITTPRGGTRQTTMGVTE